MSGPEPTAPDVNGRRATIAAALLSLLAVAVYASALHNPFVYDDWETITHNASIANWRDWHYVLLGSQRPIVNVTYALNRALSGDSPFGYHAVNILIHALNVFLLFRLTASRPKIAVAAAGLMAVHPLLSESVGYTGARAGLLCTTFLLAGLYAFGRAAATGKTRFLVGAAAAWLLGLGCKETAGLLPLAYLAWDYWIARGDAAARRRRLWTFHLPLLTLTACAIVWRVFIHARIERGGHFNFQYSLIQTEVIWRYLRLFVLPIGQTIRHPVPEAPPWHAWLALVALAAVAAAAVRWRQRAPEATFATLWFLAFLAPSSVVPLIEPMAEHRVYEASAGALVLAALALARLPRRAFAGALAALFAALALATLARNRVWSSPVALWQEAARASPDDWGPHYALGDALREAGDCARAEPEYRRAMTLRPLEARVPVNLGICLAELGRLDDAEVAFERARTLAPSDAAVHHDLGTLALRRGRAAEARAEFERALALDPRYAPARRALAELDEKPRN
jgi:Flp pilus assembly protein TadD